MVSTTSTRRPKEWRARSSRRASVCASSGRSKPRSSKSLPSSPKEKPFERFLAGLQARALFALHHPHGLDAAGGFLDPARVALLHPGPALCAERRPFGGSGSGASVLRRVDALLFAFG